VEVEVVGALGRVEAWMVVAKGQVVERVAASAEEVDGGANHWCLQT
jgi:hypothetical protein